MADRTGVAASAFRYWEELGLLPAPARVSGRRRYRRPAVELVGVRPDHPSNRRTLTDLDRPRHAEPMFARVMILQY
ncbi:MerR family DNA-binding transcriptional regulator [Actinomadura alba]|uniref:MerR family DNA-binding transcriptional regulator n=1 Tax=Actinomadura alba TaxID=406431 RepID=UPI001C9D56E9|nr:MerR family DNA-binding transcriptional regulator [Actinomadura alba]